MTEKRPDMSPRMEHDLLGSRSIPAGTLWGIHTLRATENFPLAGRAVRPPLIHAYGAVKLACAQANHDLGRWDQPTFAAIEAACREMIDGALDGHIVVDALQGGAGTSTNMNVNEVLANRALQILDKPPSDYQTLGPLDDINRHQSTNDTFPTALRVAAIGALGRLERQVIALVEAFQAKEKQFADVVKIGRTEMQDAVLITLGREMGAYAEAFARDRWRVYKCQERLRVVNLGGTAVGSGLGAPREYIFLVVDKLRAVTGMNLARAENLVEATQNADAYVEVSGILKALAVSLLKVATDLRLLSSGPHAGLGEIRLPAVQSGSSIMPGKVNPVICEAVSQVAMKAMANDQAIAHACSAGNLELNAFLPLVADCLLENLEILGAACETLATRCVSGIEADEQRCRSHVESATAMLTALVDRIGYEKATEIAQAVGAGEGATIRERVVRRGWMTTEQFDEWISPQRVMRLGSRPDRDRETQEND